MKLRVDLTDVKSIEIVEAGEYVAKLIQVEEAESAAGNPMLVWDWEIQDKSAEGVLLKSFTSLQPNALFGLKGHLGALGVPTGKVDLNTAKLHGKKAVLKVSKIDKDGRDQNRVESVKKYNPPKATQKTKVVEDDDDRSPFLSDDDD